MKNEIMMPCPYKDCNGRLKVVIAPEVPSYNRLVQSDPAEICEISVVKDECEHTTLLYEDDSFYNDVLNFLDNVVKEHEEDFYEREAKRNRDWE